MMMGDGCCVNQLAFLLHDAGFSAFNIAEVFAVTDVILLRLKFQDLYKFPEASRFSRLFHSMNVTPDRSDLKPYEYSCNTIGQ